MDPTTIAKARFSGVGFHASLVLSVVMLMAGTAAWLPVARASSRAHRSPALATAAPGAPGSALRLALLSDVTANSRTAAWAVGYEASSITGPTDTAIMRWNGRAWRRIASPNPGSSGNALIAVSALSAKFAWAVGEYELGQTGKFRTLILRWNGRAWRQVRSPDPGAANSALLAVSAVSPDSAWAAGYYQRSATGPEHAMIVHWNGKAWQRIASPKTGIGSSSLWGIRVTKGSGWAVGNRCVSRCRTSGQLLGTLVERWNGRNWSAVRSPSAANSNNLLVGVAASSPSSAWATGYSCAGPSTCLSLLHARRTLILHWNGSSWRRVKSPTPGRFSELGEVTVTSSRYAWSVGDYCVAIANCFNRLRTLIVRWNGRSWLRVASPNSGSASSLGGVSAVSATNAWAVGYSCITADCGQQHVLILHWNGKRWSSSAAPAILTSPAANASSTTKTVVYGFGPGCPALQHISWAHPTVRPGQAHFGLSCEVGIHRIRWRGWRRNSAFGHGSFLQFNGSGFNNRPATIALSRVRLHKKHRYLSHLIIVWKAKNGRHHKLVMNWRYNKTQHLWGWN